MTTTYGYPANGAYNETVATIGDRRYLVNTQYSAVYPIGVKHADTCEQICKMGGRCTCGLLAGVDTTALIVDGRANGKFGKEPQPVVIHEQEPVASRSNSGICPHCHSYCYGDCTAR